MNTVGTMIFAATLAFAAVGAAITPVGLQASAPAAQTLQVASR